MINFNSQFLKNIAAMRHRVYAFDTFYKRILLLVIEARSSTESSASRPTTDSTHYCTTCVGF